MNEFLDDNQKDEKENSKRIMVDEKYEKIKKAFEDYKNKEIERIKTNTKNKIQKLEKKMISEKEEKIKRINEDSKTEQERMKVDMTKEQEIEIEIIEDYVEKELSKIEAKRQKEIIKEKIIEIENNEEDYKNKKIIPLNEDSFDMQEYGENKKDTNIERRKNQENERGKKY